MTKRIINKLMKAFSNNGMTRREWFWFLLGLIVLPPILTVVVILWSK
jgi:nitrate reductase NapE component